MRDCLNQEIQVGDTVGYAVRYGNSAAMGAGVVQEITETGTLVIRRLIRATPYSGNKLGENDRLTVRISDSRRCVVVNKQ